jgi:hypothetical protein
VGTWGFGPFEDDTAVDFVDELREAVPAVARQRLIRALEDCADGRGIDDYVSAVEGCAAAALLVRYVDDELGPEEVQWLADVKPELTADLAELALRAIEKAHDPEGELAELWAESGHLSDRLTAMALVEQRLREAVGPPQDERLF